MVVVGCDDDRKFLLFISVVNVIVTVLSFLCIGFGS